MPKVLLIGWDAADWKVIQPLMDSGQMPALQMLVDNGTMGNLTTLDPVLSPMLWTSIATGKRPYRHGIYGFTEPDPEGGGIRPITNLSRKTKALWNILNQQGLRSNVVGWWPSHPAEPIDGVMVSNQYHRAPHSPAQPWPLAPGTVHPQRLAAPLAELRIHPAELVDAQLLPFVPRLHDIDPAKDRRIVAVASTLAEAATVQAAATYLAAEEPWDFMAVYFDAIDHFGHGFMKYRPPRQAWIPERDFALYQGVIDAAYRFHDLLLQGLLNRMDLRETVVILVSDHGFHPDHLRPSGIPNEPAGPAVEHREHGIFLACGPGIRRDHLTHGASLLDVAPTVLNLYGLPAGEDMDGAPLVDIFEQPPGIQPIPSWDRVPGADGSHPPDTRLSAEESQAAVDQLVALGYIDQPPENQAQAVRQTVRELDYNLARAYMDGGRHGDAVTLLERLWGEWPMEHRFGVRLAFCYQLLGRTGEQRRVVEALLDRRRREAEQARERLDAFHRELQRRREAAAIDAPLVEAAETEALDALARDALEQPEPESTDRPSLMSPAERQQYLELRNLARFSPFFMHYLLGHAAFDEGHYPEALEHLAQAEQADPDAVNLRNLIGQVYLEMGRPRDARRSFRRVTDRDRHNPDAWLGLARTALVENKPLRAARLALTAVALRYHFPLAHHTLGLALERLGRPRRAARALEVAVAQNPNLVEAHRRLEHLYANRLRDPQRARRHSRAIEQAGARIRDQRDRRSAGLHAQRVEPRVPEVMPDAPAPSKPQAARHQAPQEQPPCTITIVSGLPRSGTSMMMQMLAAGGMPVLSDGQRAADADNPKGYYEFERAKALRTDRSWLPDADGKAVKIIAQLLAFLPPVPHRYKVIFMERPLEEVLASQQAMLTRAGHEGGKLPPEKLKSVFAGQVRQVTQLLNQSQAVDMLYVNYHAVLAKPLEQARWVRDFLGVDLDVERMAAVVNGTLCRHRTAAANRAAVGT